MNNRSYVGNEVLLYGPAISGGADRQTGFRSITNDEAFLDHLAHILLEHSKNYLSRSSSARLRGEYCSQKSPYAFHDEQVTQIVLKLTTISEPDASTHSFSVGTDGARIGRAMINEVHVPADSTLALVSHSLLQYSDGQFYILDCGHNFAASVRIGVGGQKKKWIVKAGTQFSAGNTVFSCVGFNSEGDMKLRMIEGPLKGEEKFIKKSEVCFIGRSSHNSISLPDKELSRHHLQIEFDKNTGQYSLSDCSSTNGTYIQLVGPYSGRQHLTINDHILVGRTGFSINRYDFGVSEEKGVRQTMEDSCTIVQHLNITPLCIPSLFPQSFFGIFDGHGGSSASSYLSQNLHKNVSDALNAVAGEIIQVIENFTNTMTTNCHTINPTGQDQDENIETPLTLVNALTSERKYFDIVTSEKIDNMIVRALESSFQKTDAQFIATTKFPQHGSTATTALILGKSLGQDDHDDIGIMQNI